jgi:hypothetical protein
MDDRAEVGIARRLFEGETPALRSRPPHSPGWLHTPSSATPASVSCGASALRGTSASPWSGGARTSSSGGIHRALASPVVRYGIPLGEGGAHAKMHAFDHHADPCSMQILHVACILLSSLPCPTPHSPTSTRPPASLSLCLYPPHSDGERPRPSRPANRTIYRVPDQDDSSGSDDEYNEGSSSFSAATSSAAANAPGSRSAAPMTPHPHPHHTHTPGSASPAHRQPGSAGRPPPHEPDSVSIPGPLEQQLGQLQLQMRQAIQVGVDSRNASWMDAWQEADHELQERLLSIHTDLRQKEVRGREGQGRKEVCKGEGPEGRRKKMRLLQPSQLALTLPPHLLLLLLPPFRTSGGNPAVRQQAERGAPVREGPEAEAPAAGA